MSLKPRLESERRSWMLVVRFRAALRCVRPRVSTFRCERPRNASPSTYDDAISAFVHDGAQRRRISPVARTPRSGGSPFEC